MYRNSEASFRGQSGWSVSLDTRREKSTVKYKRAHEFYARTTHRANGAGVSCYVCYNLLRPMHDELSCPKCTNALAKIPKFGWIHRNAASR